MVGVSSAQNIPKILENRQFSYCRNQWVFFSQNEVAFLQIFLCFISLISSSLIVLTLCFDQEGECMHLYSMYKFQTTSQSEWFSSYWHKMRKKKITQPTTKKALPKSQEERRIWPARSEAGKVEASFSSSLLFFSARCTQDVHDASDQVPLQYLPKPPLLLKMHLSKTSK